MYEESFFGLLIIWVHILQFVQFDGENISIATDGCDEIVEHRATIKGSLSSCVCLFYEFVRMLHIMYM